MTEIWEPIEQNPAYLISNLGNVWSIKRNKLRKQNDNSAGYIRVQLGSGSPKYLVHKLVAKAFVDGYFEGAVVNHKDLNKHNNMASNLEWVSRSENSSHAYKNGHQPGSFKNKPYIVMSLDGEQREFERLPCLASYLHMSASKLYRLLDEHKCAYLEKEKLFIFPKCLTTIPDECKGVENKLSVLETARHLEDGRYSLISLETASSSLERNKSSDLVGTKMVMGYYRSVSQWNEGKQGEFEDREYFKETKCHLDEEESK